MSIVRNRPSIEIKPSACDLSGLSTRYFNQNELSILIGLIRSRNAKTVIEFGVNNGRTPVAVMRNVPSITRYIGIDVTRDYKTTMPVQRNEVPAIPGELALSNPHFELVVSERGSFDLTPDDLPNADVAFIDADHSRAGVENDYRLAKAVVRRGGLIIFHDDNCLPVVEVTQTLNDLCDAGAEIIHVANTWISYEVCQ